MSGSDSFWYLFAGYGAFWVLLALFLAYLGRQNQALEKELRSLESRIPSGPKA